MSETENWRPAYIGLSQQVEAGGLPAAEAEQKLLDDFGEVPIRTERHYIPTVTGNPFWPIGLCIAWILKRHDEDAAERWRQHRMWSEVGLSDGWPEAK